MAGRVVGVIRGQIPDIVKCAGSGDGSGDGYGAGYGAGSGDGDYWSQAALSAIDKWTLAQRDRFSELEKSADVLALWKSTQSGAPANGGSKTKAAPGLVETVDGPLRICSQYALHATMNPEKWKGERLWVVALFGEIQQQEDKYGALQREIIGEILT